MGWLRISAYLRDGAVRIMTSGGLDWTARFPAITAAIADLPLRSANLDGEAVVLDEHGRSHFGVCKWRSGATARTPVPVVSFPQLTFGVCRSMVPQLFSL